MVVPLGPGKFYGSSLPRPRIYTDVKFNSDRIDPPVPVTDPLLSWAQEAHWSMGGLSFQRLRFQGRIEGNVNRLRKIREKEAKLLARSNPEHQKGADLNGANDIKNDNGKRVGSVSPPPAPNVTKRRRVMAMMDDDSEEEEDEENQVVEKVKESGRKKWVRKLVGDFEKAAKESLVDGKRTNSVGVKTRRSGSGGGGVGDVVMKVVEEINRDNSSGKNFKGERKGTSVEKNGSSLGNAVRSSPRLAKQRSSN